MLSAYITHPSSLLHEMGRDHPESPERVSAVNDHLLIHGVLDFMQPYAAPAATRAQVERVHTSLYVAELAAGAPTSGYSRIDPDTLMNPHTLEAAWPRAQRFLRPNSSCEARLRMHFAMCGRRDITPPAVRGWDSASLTTSPSASPMRSRNSPWSEWR